MKKFMFSAVALVVFSFTGMANTGGEEKYNISEDLSSNEYLLAQINFAVPKVKCLMEFWNVYYTLLEDFSSAEAMENAMAYYDYCNENK